MKGALSQVTKSFEHSRSTIKSMWQIAKDNCILEIQSYTVLDKATKLISM